MSALSIRKRVEAAWCRDEFDVVPAHEEPLVFWAKGRGCTFPNSQPTAGLGVLSARGAHRGKGDEPVNSDSAHNSSERESITRK